jgi:hypothetical protein
LSDDPRALAYDRIVAAAAPPIMPQLRTALRQKERGDLAAARVGCTSLIELNPDYAAAYLHLIGILHHMGEHAGANDMLRLLSSHVDEISASLPALTPGDFLALHDSLVESSPEEAATAIDIAWRMRPADRAGFVEFGNRLVERNAVLSAWNLLMLITAERAAGLDALEVCRFAARLIEATAAERETFPEAARRNWADSTSILALSMGARIPVKEAIDLAVSIASLTPDSPVANYNIFGLAFREAEYDQATEFALRFYLIDDPYCPPQILQKQADAQVLRSACSAAYSQFHNVWRQNPIKIMVNRHLARLLPTIPPSERRTRRATSGRRPIRLAFCSDQFEADNVQNIFFPLFRELDRERVTVDLYGTGPSVGDGFVSEKLRAITDGLHHIATLSDAEAADLIEKNDPDVLFGLDGPRGRYGIFARHPARVQCAWFHESYSTGTFDYIMSDQTVLNDKDRSEFTESIIDFPCFLAFELGVLGTVPTLPAPPFEHNGYITFGCFSSPSKLSKLVIDSWIELLLATPHSRLIWRNGAIELGGTSTGGTANQRVCARIVEHLLHSGIPADRFECIGHAPYHEFLAGHGNVDIVLDSYPVGNGNTLANALWLGAPMASYLGDWPLERVTASLLYAAGLSELVAANRQDYVELLKKLASDHGWRRAIVASLPACRTSSLFDVRAWARRFEDAMETVCAKRDR